MRASIETMSIMKQETIGRSLALATLSLGSTLHGNTITAIPYSIPETPWKEGYGLHRAVIEASQPVDAAYVVLPWRRRDDPTKKCIIITDANHQPVLNIFRVSMDSEQATLVFGPLPTAGQYFIYYLPFPVQTGSCGGYWQDYLPPEPAPNTAWVEAHGLTAGMDPASHPALVAVRLSAFQSRTEFDSVYPMELPITRAEKTGLLARNESLPCLLFPEDRRYPIRMPEAIPVRWLDRADNHFSGQAMRNEYYTFQVGVYATTDPLNHLNITFSDLRFENETLSAARLTCFNTGGIDCYGKTVSKTVNVPADTVQALWMGVDIPHDAHPGTYSGTVLIAAENLHPMPVNIELTIDEAILEDRGDSELWRHSRLRWLNSTRGTADTPIPPYPPLERSDNHVTCLGRTVDLTEGGMPKQIQSFGSDILASPLQFIAETLDGPITLQPEPMQFTHENAGSISWKSRATSDVLDIECEATMEFDGYLHCALTLTARHDMDLADTRLELPFRREIATHMMGMGVPGGLCPEKHDWTWEGPQDGFWMGNAQAGLHCELRGSTYHGPLLNRIRPPHPPTWSNEGRGGLRVTRSADRVNAKVYTGAWTLRAGEPVTFEFALIVTPVKPLVPARQFTDRYFHNTTHPIPTEEQRAKGITVVNIHHGNMLNPYINYPLLPDATGRMKEQVADWHKHGIKTKIYYTLRELSNHVHELWALRSLGYEVLADGGGGGYPWLREHLRDHYWPRWYHHHDDNGNACAAIANSGESRWYNYYIESLAWLLEHVDIDGLYLDDVSYDRRIVKRMRRVMAEVKPDCLIDLHSNTGFSIGPATQYTEFFPYIDKLWFGESFHYNEMSPDQWLVEVSGIPFGLMGDMLHAGGNRWLGMVYGMTARMPWTDAPDPEPIWKVWDEFGIADSRMVGYWNPDCPVTTDHPDVKVTAYIRKGRTLLAIGSWAKESTDITLTIDWGALDLDPAKAKLSAPAIEEFQDAHVWTPESPIHVIPLRGWLVYLEL